MEKYRKIEGKTFAKIYTDYRKGGYNNFRGSTDERGIVLYFNTVEIDGSCEMMTPMASENFKVLVKALGRKSSKQEDRVDDAVMKRIDKLFDLYIEDNERFTLLKMIDEIKSEVR